MPRRRPAHLAGGPDDKPLVDRDTDMVEPSGGAESPDALQAMLEGLDDPTGYEVCVFEVNTDGTRHMLARQGVSEFDPWAFGEQWGGGVYEMRLREVDTKRWGRQRRFTVSPRVPRRTSTPAAAAQPAATPVAADPTRDMLALMMGLVQNQAQQQTAILTALIGRPQQATPLGELVQAAQLLTGKGPSSPIGELLEGVERIQKLTGAAGGASASEEVELARTFAPIIGELMKRPAAAPTRPAPTNSTGGAGAGALPPAPPAPSPEAQSNPPAAPKPTRRDIAAAAGCRAAIDTLAAIIVRIGIDAGGEIDQGAIERITAQASEAIDVDALEDMLDLVPLGHLADYVLDATPTMLREQVGQHRDALQRIEQMLRAEFGHQDADDAEKPAQEAAKHETP